MELPDKFPSEGELILIALLEADDTSTTASLRDAIETFDRDQINYRIGRLADLGLVETKRQGVDDTGQHLPKKVWLTDQGKQLATEASEEFRFQIDVTDDTVSRNEDELAAIQTHLEELEDRVDHLTDIIDDHAHHINTNTERLDDHDTTLKELQDTHAADIQQLAERLDSGTAGGDDSELERRVDRLQTVLETLIVDILTHEYGDALHSNLRTCNYAGCGGLVVADSYVCRHHRDNPEPAE